MSRFPIPLPETPSEQDVFDTIVRHAAAMPEKSFSPRIGHCAYRADENACFIGCLLTDEQARMGDELTFEDGGSVSTLAEKDILPAHLMPHVDLLSHVQPTHDEYCPEEWPDHFREIAQDRGLSMAVIDEVFPASA